MELLEKYIIHRDPMSSFLGVSIIAPCDTRTFITIVDSAQLNVLYRLDESLPDFFKTGDG